MDRAVRDVHARLGELDIDVAEQADAEALGVATQEEAGAVGGRQRDVAVLGPARPARIDPRVAVHRDGARENVHMTAAPGERCVEAAAVGEAYRAGTECHIRAIQLESGVDRYALAEENERARDRGQPGQVVVNVRLPQRDVAKGHGVLIGARAWRDVRPLGGGEPRPRHVSVYSAAAGGGIVPKIVEYHVTREAARVQRVAAAAAQHRTLDAHERACLKRCVGPNLLDMELAVREDHVAERALAHDIVAGAASERIRAGAAGQRIVTGGAEQGVIARPAIEDDTEAAHCIAGDAANIRQYAAKTEKRRRRGAPAPGQLHHHGRRAAGVVGQHDAPGGCVPTRGQPLDVGGRIGRGEAVEGVHHVPHRGAPGELEQERWAVVA